MGFWNLFANSWIRGSRKPIAGSRNKIKRRSLSLESLEDRTVPTSFINFVDPNPSAGNGFGTTILSLGSGKVAVTAPYDDFAATDAGAVYVYNGSTGALVSTIRGSHAGDNLGSDGLFAVGTSSTGNFLIASPNWDNGSISNAGALTFVSGSPASSITVSSANSLVGSTAGDAVGTGANVKVLTNNNNYVVASPLWNGTAADVGAVTWGSGSSGVVGTISSSNSYVGVTTNDRIGSSGIAALSNGNYAFASPLFDTTVADAGAVTWGDGSTGSTGTVATSNSWVGSNPNDNVGSGGLTALTGNGNFVISSPIWDNYISAESFVSDAGAATWVDGSGASSGVLSSTNSFVGNTGSDKISSDGVFALTNGNYVICSSYAEATDVGAVTWSGGISSTKVTGTVSNLNSLEGAGLSFSIDRVGSGGVTVLNNGSFVAKSPLWQSGLGAATWGSGTAAITGLVSSSNSLVGSTAGDAVGTSVVALTGGNNNYVVVTKGWDNGSTADVGAVTWGSSSAGVSGTISAANSIVGSTASDQVGSGGVTALSNGNYVVVSPLWNGSAVDVGAVTWGNGSAATGATVGTGNSWVGSTTNDQVGSGGVTALTGSGNFVIVSPLWDNGGTANVGAATRLTGSATSNGTISTSNSLYGDSANDQVGSGGITALANGNYLVASPLWNNGATTDAGAVTSLRGSVASAGTVSANYSIKGTTANISSLGAPSVDTVNSNFYTRFNVNVSGQAGGTILAGSINPTPPAITSASSTTITYGDVLSFTVTATGDPGVGSTVPGAIVFSTSGLPSGISLNSSTGVLSGTSGSTPAGTYNFTITASNKVGSDATQNFTLTINQKNLTITGTTAANKVYDNTNTATPNTSSSALSGVIGSDAVTLNKGSVTGTFAQTTVGTGITVTFAGFTISGAAAGNYSLTQPTTTANITQATLTVTGLTGNNKVYNSSTTATASGTATLSGVIAGTSVTLGGTPTYTFASANVGTGISISTTGYTINNANYSLTQPTLSANITQATLTVTGLTGDNKVYSATTGATATGTPTLSGVIGSDSVTIGGTPTYTFASANVGTGISISTTGFTISGASSDNYSLTQPTLSANITQATLTATVSGTTTKVYTGTTAATIVTSNITFVGLKGSQNFTFNNATLAGTYNNANVASASSVTGSIASSDVTGTNGGLTSNYIFPATVTGTGAISAAPLVITPVNAVRPFGATNPTFTATYSGLVNGETSSVVSGLVLTSPSLISSAVGNYAISGSSASAANYSISYVEGVLTVAGAVALTDPNPSSGDGFGTVTQYLTNGNVVVTAPYDDAGGTNAGAVYLFNSTTGALISTLKGSSSGDQVGISGVTLLSNGNFLVISQNWSGGKGAITFVNASTGLTASVGESNSLLGVTTSDHLGLYPVLALKNGNYVVRNPNSDGGKGSVTWGSGTSGATGTISASNSLVGSNTTDAVGSLAITELTNGNYAARSPQWNGALGAVTWGSGTTGTVGVVGSANSLVGSTANDQVGSAALTTLANGNFVVASPNWDNGEVSEAGAVTWLNGLNGKTYGDAYGAVSSSNSLVGSTTGDHVGYGGVTKLVTNNNYVVTSPNWGGTRGAVTWASGTGATFGVVGAGNSIVGNIGSTDNVGSGTTPVTALSNGNYVVTSPNWGSNKGAVTLGDGTSGTSGIVDSSTSMVGTVAGSYVGSTGITELSNSNFVIQSSSWSDGTNASAGAATFASGSVASGGTVTSANSLVGSNANDAVGSKVTILKNNNYVVLSSDWNGKKGAVTWGSGTTGISGVVSSTNSLVGSTTNDNLGSGGVTVLSDNNFIVSSPNWSNGGQTAAGAATFGFATNATTGVVGSGNSLVGTHTNDKVGSGGVTVLGAGKYLVSSPLWNSDTASEVGAVTYGSGAAILAASVSSSNSLVGSTTNDQVGSGGITVLSNGNYVVASPLFDNGLADTGAVTWASLDGGISGAISSSNSLVGTHANDKVGSGGVTALKTNGNYVVASPLWNSTLGAVTWGSGSVGTNGSVTSSNSLVGSTSGDKVGSGGVTALTGGNYLVRSTDWNNDGLAKAGALTWGSGTNGISGSVAATNSMVGVSANAGLSTVSENATTSTYFVTFLTETNGARVSVGYQTPTSPTFTSADHHTFTVGNAGSFTFTASGNPASVFTLNAGSLPTGLTLNSLTGVLSGTPATGSQGTYNLTIRASNSWGGGYADQSFTLTIN